MTLRIINKGLGYALQQKNGYSVLSYWKTISKSLRLREVLDIKTFIEKSLL